MANFVVVRDFRLHAGVPNRPGLGIINTDERTPLSSVFQRINAYARWGRIKAIFILAHGKAGKDYRPRTDGTKSFSAPGVVCKDAGGMGVSVGAEGIRHYNVQLWSAIRGRAKNIVIYACAAADTQLGNEGTLADGKYLMGALALHTGATVFAATGVQYMRTYNNLCNGRFIHPKWSGQLFRFPPDGSPGKPIPPPVSFEFDDVMDGTAR
jgi:hypothetical protein